MITLDTLLGEAVQKRRPQLTPDQVEARLLEAYAAIHTTPPETFEPGTIVWHKVPHLSPYRDTENPMIFGGYLARPIEGDDLLSKPAQLTQAFAAKTVDCRVGCLCSGTYHLHLMHSRELTATRPQPAAAAAEAAAETPAAEPAPEAETTDDADAAPASPARAPSPWTEPVPA